MSILKNKTALFSALFLFTVALAACGGGGGGGGTGGGGGGGGVTPTPTPQPSAAGAATVNGAPLAAANVVFSCGCTDQAGTTTANASGDYTIGATATATPNSPTPTYTMVPGRNYVVVAANPTTHQEAWSFFWLGNGGNNLYLEGQTTATTDQYTAAAALYVYYESPANIDQSFDDWNYNSVSNWVNNSLKGSPTTAETKLMNDITSAQTAGTRLYPRTSPWDNDPGATNSTIANDIQTINSEGVAADSNLPTPCPVNGTTPQCTGTPTP